MAIEDEVQELTEQVTELVTDVGELSDTVVNLLGVVNIKKSELDAAVELATNGVDGIQDAVDAINVGVAQVNTVKGEVVTLLAGAAATLNNAQDAADTVSSALNAINGAVQTASGHAQAAAGSASSVNGVLTQVQNAACSVVTNKQDTIDAKNLAVQAVADAQAKVVLATNQVTLATTQASNAAGSATTANTRAGAANTSAQAAAASATEAAGYANQASQGQINSNWNETNAASKAFIQNKPTIPTNAAGVGLGNVANLAPVDLPVSSATALALAEKAPTAAPTFTGLTSANNLALSGALAVGAALSPSQTVRVSKNVAGGATAIGVQNDGVIQAVVTSLAAYNNTNAATVAASFTLPNLSHYRAAQGTIGAGSTVTSQYGFVVDATLIGATNNYAFAGNIAAGATRWNLYMAGTAKNYIAGNLLLGSTVDSGSILQVTGDSVFTGNVTINGAVAGVTKANVGLGNVSNIAPADMPISNAAAAAISARALGVDKDATNGYVGLTGFAINCKNAAGTFTSLLSNTATAVRNWQLPDKSGTVAMLSDLTTGGTGAGGAIASGNVTLTSASGGAQSLTSTAAGQFVKLPDATGCTLGASVFSIKENGVFDRWVMDSTGAFLGVIHPGVTVNIGLADKTTAAGVWHLVGADIAGVEAMGALTLPLALASNSLMRVVPLSATRTLFFIFASNVFYAIVHDQSTGLFGALVTLAGFGPSNNEGIITTVLPSGKVMYGIVNSSTNRVYIGTLTVTGTSIAANAPVPTPANGILFQVLSEFVAVNGYYAFGAFATIAGSTYSGICVVSVADETTPVIGGFTEFYAGGGRPPDIIVVAPNTILMFAPEVNAPGSAVNTILRAATVTSTAPNMGAAVYGQSPSTFGPTRHYLKAQATSGRALLVVAQATVYASTIYVSGVTITMSGQVACGQTATAASEGGAFCVHSVGGQHLVASADGIQARLFLLGESPGAAPIASVVLPQTFCTFISPLGEFKGEVYFATTSAQGTAVLLKAKLASGTMTVTYSLRQSFGIASAFGLMDRRTITALPSDTLKSARGMLGIRWGNTNGSLNGSGNASVFVDASGLSYNPIPNTLVRSITGALNEKGFTDAESWSGFGSINSAMFFLNKVRLT